MTQPFTEEQVQRYARHIILPNIGGAGQRKLLDASVLVIGAGGLGSPIAMYLADVYNCAANLAGIPAMSLPCGFVDGLPVGMQLMGNYFDESRLLNVAHQYQQATEWHKQMPKEFA